VKVSFEGIGECVVTFYNKDSLVTAGSPVKMTGNGEAGPCGDGDRVIGRAIAGQGDFCAVQTRGYMRLRCGGSIPPVGYARLVADGDGGVRTDELSGGEVLILDVDSASGLLGVML
jgi:hypothetical protein